MYELFIHRRVKKQIKKIPNYRQEKIMEFFLVLSKNPFANQFQIKKIDDTPLTFRCRIGKFRIIYVIEKNKKKIYIRRIEHRQWDYKKMLSF